LRCARSWVQQALRFVSTTGCGSPVEGNHPCGSRRQDPGHDAGEDTRCNNCCNVLQKPDLPFLGITVIGQRLGVRLALKCLRRPRPAPNSEATITSSGTSPPLDQGRGRRFRHCPIPAVILIDAEDIDQRRGKFQRHDARRVGDDQRRRAVGSSRRASSARAPTITRDHGK
jgi:hypothetical protein